MLKDSRATYLVNIFALATLHNLAKCCKKCGKIHMLHILAILALATLHNLAKPCRKLCKIHMLCILSILAMILPNITRNLARLCMVQSCQDVLPCTFKIIQDGSCKTFLKLSIGIFTPHAQYQLTIPTYTLHLPLHAPGILLWFSNSRISIKLNAHLFILSEESFFFPLLFIYFVVLFSFFSHPQKPQKRQMPFSASHVHVILYLYLSSMITFNANLPINLAPIWHTGIIKIY